MDEKARAIIRSVMENEGFTIAQICGLSKTPRTTFCNFLILGQSPRSDNLAKWLSVVGHTLLILNNDEWEIKELLND